MSERGEHGATLFNGFRQGLPCLDLSKETDAIDTLITHSRARHLWLIRSRGKGGVGKI